MSEQNRFDIDGTTRRYFKRQKKEYDSNDTEKPKKNFLFETEHKSKGAPHQSPCVTKHTRTCRFGRRSLRTIAMERWIARVDNNTVITTTTNNGFAYPK
jgi:hypothetical protein